MIQHRAAVLGRPIGHSLSPVIHNAGYAAAGLTGWNYDAHDCAEDGLAPFVAGLDASWVGLSLTMPLKAVALDVADDVAPDAATLGAANTLVRRGERGWRAENTDAPGMVDALAEAGVLAAQRVCILGAGGTARAALAAARDLGATSVTVAARRTEAFDELAPVADRLGLAILRCPWTGAAEAASQAEVVLSTVPRGVADPLAGLVHWAQGSVLFDAIYDPWPTPLAASAVAANCRIVSGLDLLLAQAVRQFTLFTGADPPVPAMSAALHDAASHRPPVQDRRRPTG